MGDACGGLREHGHTHLDAAHAWERLQHTLKCPLLEGRGGVRGDGLEEPAVRADLHVACGAVHATCRTGRPPRDHDRQRVRSRNGLAEGGERGPCFRCKGPHQGFRVSKIVVVRPRRAVSHFPPPHAFRGAQRAAQRPIPVEHSDATDRCGGLGRVGGAERT